MKKLLVFVAVAAGCLASNRVEASAFTLNSYAVTVHTTDPGLVLWEKDLLSTPDPFTLTAVGESVTQKLFQLGTNETVAFNFVTPTFQGTTRGITGAGWWKQSFGYVVWDNPLTLAFGNTGLLGISLTNSTFGLPGATDISATFRLVQADTVTSPTAVPEPSSSMLLSVAAVGLLVRRRRLA